jgi:hypothetical protein
MGTQPDLSSAEAKWERAQFHAQKLLHRIFGWAHNDNDPAIRVGLEDDLKRHRTLVYVKSVKRIPPKWGLELGDALHNYRSALNYIAASLIRVGLTPGEALNATFQFPVCRTTPTDFYAPIGPVRRDQLPGVRLKYLRAISPFQPYKARGNRWVLPAIKTLNNLDKHSQPVLAAHYVKAQLAVISPSYLPAAAPIATFKSLHPRSRLEPGTKLGHVTWLTGERPIILLRSRQPTGKSEMRVHLHPISGVVLENLQPNRTVFVSGFVDAADRLLDGLIRKIREV